MDPTINVEVCPNHSTTLFVGLDVHTNSITVADATAAIFPIAIRNENTRRRSRDTELYGRLRRQRARIWEFAQFSAPNYELAQYRDTLLDEFVRILELPSVNGLGTNRV